MSIKFEFFITIVLLAVGFAFGRFSAPVKTETKIVTQIQKVEVIKHDTTTTETVKPDGTKTTVTVDKSVDTDKSTAETSSDKVVENAKPQWLLSGTYGLQPGTIGPIYGATVQRRILGPIFLGVVGNTTGAVAVSIGLEL